MSGETKLSKIIREMQPQLNNGEYVFVSIKSPELINRKQILSEFKEKEGSTLILERKYADIVKLNYDFVASWITISVHTSLEAEGLTSVVSTELAENNISCNIVAGYFHDHIFVKSEDTSKALKVLMDLSSQYGK